MNYFDLRVEREEDPIAFASELQYKSAEFLMDSHGDELEIYGGCAPSCGKETDRGDYSSITVVGRDKNGTIYVLVSDSVRQTAHETIEMILAYHQKYRFKHFAIETNQAQIVIAQELEQRGRECGILVPVEYITSKDNKITRIQRLQPLLKCGTIQLCRGHRMLIDQMRYFPRGRYDDSLDSLELAIRVAEHSREITVKIIGRSRSLWDDGDDWSVFNRAVRG